MAGTDRKTTYAIGRIAAVALAYLISVLILTYPLIRYFNEFFIGGLEDGSMSYWGMWWFKFSLLDLGTSPLHTDYLFYPEGISLVFHSMPKLLGIINIPLQSLFGLTAGYNILVIATFVGTGLTTYWLSYHLLRQQLPAIIAGAIFMLSPYRWGQISHLTLLSTILIPVYILLLINGRESLEADNGRHWLYFGFAGIALGLTAYDTEYYAVFLVLFTLLYLAYQFPFKDRAQGLSSWTRLLAGTALSLALAVLVFSPMLVAVIVEVARHGNYAAGSASLAARYASDLMNMFLPGEGSAYLGGVFSGLQQTLAEAEPSYLGWTPLALAGIGVYRYRRNRDVWFWVAVALLFIILAIGPFPFRPYHFLPGFMDRIRGPFVIFSQLPLVDGIRVPSRFICMTSLSVALLAGYGLKAGSEFLKEKSAGKALLFTGALVVGLLLFVEYKPGAIFSSAQFPQAYEAIAESGAEGALLIIPLGWENGFVSYGDENSWTMLSQTLHKKPMVGGMVARVPKEKLAEQAETPVLRFLSDPAGRDPDQADKDPAIIEGFFREYGVRFIVCNKVMPDIYFDGKFFQAHEAMTPAGLEKVDAYVTDYLGMHKIEETDEVVVYGR